MSELKALVITLLVFSILMAAVIAACSVRFEEPKMIEQEYTIAAGETMWSIANEYCPKSMDRRDWIYKVCNLNGINQDKICAGQTITILVEEGGK